MMFKNQTILDIKYTLTNEKNIEKLKMFERFQKLPI